MPDNFEREQIASLIAQLIIDYPELESILLICPDNGYTDAQREIFASLATIRQAAVMTDLEVEVG